jgi:uncharacterized protein (UPF0212 family)
MTEDDAKVILRAVFEAYDVLNFAAADLSKRLGEDEARSVRIDIGYVLTELGDRLFEPALAAHPQLRPGNTNAEWAALRKAVGARDQS